MGCSFSRPSRRDADSNPRVFKVFNVDDQGQELSAGKIEITEADLVLHQKSKEPIRWPLRSLRRYGFDAELFSFESGRRCPTGPGIYAFKCRRAEALFNLLQECIQRAGQEEAAARPAVTAAPATDGVTAATATSASASRPGSLIEIHTPNGSLPTYGGSVAGSVGGVSGGVGALSGAPSPHHYVNGFVVPLSPPHGSTPCPCPPSSHGLNVVSSASSSSVAVVSGGSGVVVVAGNGVPPTIVATHEYVNTEIAVGAVGPSCSSSTRAGSHQSLDLSGVQLRMVPPCQHRPSVGDVHVVNYAELDLPKSLEELTNGSGSGAAGHLPHHQGVSIVELDPSSSQATYINVPADPDAPQTSGIKRTLVPSSTTTAMIMNGASSGTGSGTAMRKVLIRQASKEDQHNYANLDILSSAAARGGGEGARGRKVTYIQVDVRSSKENLYAGSNPPASPISLSPSIPDSPRRTESYAQIDFHKTAAAALSKVANSEDEGFRKTRHNSNIEELN